MATVAEPDHAEDTAWTKAHPQVVLPAPGAPGHVPLVDRHGPVEIALSAVEGRSG